MCGLIWSWCQGDLGLVDNQMDGSGILSIVMITMVKKKYVGTGLPENMYVYFGLLDKVAKTWRKSEDTFFLHIPLPMILFPANLERWLSIGLRNQLEIQNWVIARLSDSIVDSNQFSLLMPFTAWWHFQSRMVNPFNKEIG